LIPFLTPWEFWQFVGDAYGVPREEQRLRLYEFADFVELPSHVQRKKKFIRDFSQGQRKKIGLVAAIMVRPRRLVLDEPFTHLDPRSRARFEELVLSLHASHGTATVISSHDLEHVVDVSDRVLLIEEGRILFDGSVDRNTLHVIRTHLTGRPLPPASR
ncbi:MAG: AAA family ATPase, partial [Rhodothermales bacterium]